MRGTPLLLVACVAGAVLLAGCTGDEEATGDTYGGDGSRELSTDVEVAPGDGSGGGDGGEAAANETSPETGSGG